MKKIVFIIAAVALMLAIRPEAKSQAALYNLLSTPYGLTSDTISNAATVTLTSGVVSGGSVTATVQINITEISGTTAGTITLFGSLNGTEWIALTDASAVPAIATKTATDVASQQFIWRVTGNPMRYYRVSWTGTGTMSDRLTAQLVVR